VTPITLVSYLFDQSTLTGSAGRLRSPERGLPHQ
jgi:hypothetical protein